MRIKRSSGHSTLRKYDRLEPRLLLACDVAQPIDIVGTPGNDTISVHIGFQSLQVVVNGNATDYPILNLNQLVIDGLGGSDNFLIYDNSGVVDNTVELCPTTARFSGLLDVFGVHMEKVSVFAGGGQDTVILRGSVGNDMLNVSQSSTLMTGPGYSQRASGFDQYFVHANLGSDSAYVTDSPGADTFIGGQISSRMEYSSGAIVGMSDFDTTYVSSTAGEDLVALNGSIFADRFYSRPGFASLNVNAAQSVIRASGFSTVISNGGLGEDTASLVDSAGNDSVFSRPDYSNLLTPNYESHFNNYEKTFVIADNGGFDVATLVDSAGNDGLFVSPNWTSLERSGPDTYVSHFDQVNVYASGGYDTAVVQNMPGVQTFRGERASSEIESDNGDVLMANFDRVFASGGRLGLELDQAELKDSSGNDQLYSNLESSLLIGAGYLISIRDFWDTSTTSLDGDDVAYFTTPHYTQFDGSRGSSFIDNSSGGFHGESRANGFDKVVVNFTGQRSIENRVNLTGTSGTDNLIAEHEFAKLTGPDYSITARNGSWMSFEGGGGNDVATLTDTGWDETVTLSNSLSSMIGADGINNLGYNIYLHDVPRVTVFATRGGFDQLSLVDTIGDDFFYGTNSHSSVSGNGFQLLGVGFDSVSSTSVGGDDEATLYDSPDDNFFAGFGNQAILQGGVYHSIAGYEIVRAVSLNGGFDRLTATDIEFQLIASGNWNP